MRINGKRWQEMETKTSFKWSTTMLSVICAYAYLTQCQVFNVKFGRFDFWASSFECKTHEYEMQTWFDCVSLRLKECEHEVCWKWFEMLRSSNASVIVFECTINSSRPSNATSGLLHFLTASFQSASSSAIICAMKSARA